MRYYRYKYKNLTYTRTFLQCFITTEILIKCSQQNGTQNHLAFKKIILLYENIIIDAFML